MSKPYIKEYINARLKELEEKRVASGEEVLQYLTAVMRGEVKDQFDFDASLQDRTKAAELLGKRHGLFREKLELSGVDKEKSKLDNLISQMRGD